MEKTAYILYLVVLLLSPLLFGSPDTYAYTIMSLGVLTAGVLLLNRNIRKNPKTGQVTLTLPETFFNPIFLVVLLFLVFQTIPLPDSLLGLLSPEATVLSRKSFPASKMINAYGTGAMWSPLAPYVHPVRMSVIRWVVYGFFFLGLCQVLTSRKRIDRAVSLILILGCFETLYGLMETYSGSAHIWWFKKIYYIDDVTGTYINRNHFAGLMEMCLLLAAAFMSALAGRRKKVNAHFGPKPGLRSRVLQFLSVEQRFNKRLLVFFAGVVMGIGLVFSASRGGMIGAAGGLLCLSLLLLFRKDYRRKGLSILAVFLIILIYSLHIGAEHPVSRFKTFGADLGARERYARKTVEMFKDYKLTGVGVGNWPDAYPKYQATEDKEGHLPHAHNDWVQFLAEAGIIGLCILLSGLFYFAYRLLRLRRKRRDPFAVSLGAGAVAAMAAIAIHSWSDFNLHIPANFLMLMAVGAIGYSALHLQRHHGVEKSLAAYRVLPLKYKGFIVLSLILCLMLWAGVWTVRNFVAECYCATTFHAPLNRDKNPALEEIKMAIAWNGENAVYWWKLAWELIGIRDRDILSMTPEERDDIQMEIIRAFEEAVRLNPFKAEYHLQVGWEYARMGDQPDYSQRWLPAADITMERAAYLAGDKFASLHEGLGNYWIVRSKTLGPADPQRESAWTKANWHYKKALALSKDPKSRKERISKYVFTNYPDETFVEKALE